MLALGFEIALADSTIQPHLRTLARRYGVSVTGPWVVTVPGPDGPKIVAKGRSASIALRKSFEFPNSSVRPESLPLWISSTLSPSSA